MADRRNGDDKSEPTLELPKLFGRRRPRVRTPARVDQRSVDGASGATTTERGLRRARRAAPLPPRTAALVTGVLVGGAGALLTYASLHGCETLTGTGSCGEGLGLLLLAAIFAAMVLLGGGLLRLCQVGDPQSTSFLAVGITAVVVMLTLLDIVFSAWMFLIVPLVSMAAFLVAHWVTSRFADPDS